MNRNRRQIESKIHELLQTHSQMELMQMRESFSRIRAIHHAGVKGATVETTLLANRGCDQRRKAPLKFMKILAWDVADDGGTIFGLYSVSGSKAELTMCLQEIRRFKPDEVPHLAISASGVLSDREHEYLRIFRIFQSAKR